MISEKVSSLRDKSGECLIIMINQKFLKNVINAGLAVLVIIIIAICAAVTGRKEFDKKSASDISLYEDTANAFVTLSGDTAVVEGTGVAARGAEITIADGGAYIFSGELNDGRIRIETANSKDVTIILNGVSISNNEKAVIFCKSGRSVTIIAASGTENTLTSGKDSSATIDADSQYKENLKGSLKAVIMSKRDLDLKGDGVLNINGYVNNGIQSKGNLNITDLTLNLVAANDGLKSGADMTVGRGVYNLKARGDAVSSMGKLTIDDASFNIITGDGADSVEKKVNSQEDPEDALGEQSDEPEPDKLSSKGIKSEGIMTISSGTFLIDCIDDGIHCSDDIVINGGSIEIKAADDGIRADKNLVINDGTVNVAYSYEGIEAAAVIFNGGDTSVKAGDDGISSSVLSEDCRIEVNGGRILVDCEGDGLDSAKDVIINAGDVHVNGSSTGVDSPVDIGTDEGGRFLINGGTLLALGYSDYIDGTDEGSEQLTLIFNCDNVHSPGETVTVFDSVGQVVLSYVLEKNANSITFSSDELRMGDIYTFVVGDEDGQIVADRKCAWK